MLARVLTLNVRPEKMDIVRTYMKDEFLPLLKKLPGWVDTIALVKETKPVVGTIITFFKTRPDIDRYEKELYPKLIETIQPHLTTTPTVEILNVEVSTVHKIMEAVAA